MTWRALKRLTGVTSYYGLLAIATGLALVPTVWLMLSSFKTSGQIYSGSTVVPHPFTLQGYSDAFTEVHLHQYVLNSLLYAGGGTLGALFTGLLAAYPLARLHFWGRNGLVAAFSLALAIPVVGLITPIFFVVRELGLYDSKLGLVLFYSALQFPLAFVILRAFLVSLPREVEEAALVDGAGYFSIVFRIVVPLARPALATVAVVSFVGIWNEFLFANLLTPSLENQNVQLALAGFQSQFKTNVGGTMAGATIVMLVPIIVFLLLQRQVIEGLTAGATK